MQCSHVPVHHKAHGLLSGQASNYLLYSQHYKSFLSLALELLLLLYGFAVPWAKAPDRMSVHQTGTVSHSTDVVMFTESSARRIYRI